MSIILQALAKNQNRLIPDNPTPISTEPAPAAATRPRRRTGHAPLPDITPIWDDAQTRSAEALAAASAPPTVPQGGAGTAGLSEVRISWVLTVVAMGCMFGMVAAFYPPARVEARIAAQPATAPLPAAEAEAVTELAAVNDTEPAFAITEMEASPAPTGPALEPVFQAAEPATVDPAASVVRVVFRKEGGQTEPDGTWRQEYALPAAPHDDAAETLVAIADPDEPLAIPGMVPVAPAGDGVAEVAYEDDTLYEAAPIPTATNETPEAPRSRFKTKKSSGGGSGSTAAAPARAEEPAALRVEGIFWDRTRPMALINNDIVEIGSHVRGGKVVDIQPGSVTIEVKGERRVLMP